MVEEILKLVENVGDVYSIGQKIVGLQVESTKRHMVKELSKIMSSVMSLLIIAAALSATLIFLFLFVGSTAAVHFEAPWMNHGLPALLCLTTTLLLWWNRSTLFVKLTSSVMRDALL